MPNQVLAKVRISPLLSTVETATILLNGAIHSCSMRVYPSPVRDVYDDDETGISEAAQAMIKPNKLKVAEINHEN